MGYIYLVTNLIDKKQYIGQTICKDVNSRWNQHKRKEKKTIGKYLLSAYEKYGIENFSYKIVSICFDEDCNRFEEDYIKKFNTLAPNGYNLSAGGKREYPKDKEKKKHSKISEDTKKKIGESLLKYHQQNPHAREMKMGDKNPNFGKPMSDEQKKKISETHKKRYKEVNISDKAAKALAEGRKKRLENGASSKKVGKYDENDNLLETYNSLSEAGRQNNMGHQHISKVCNGHPSYKKAGGFIWKFLSDDMITS